MVVVGSGSHGRSRPVRRRIDSAPAQVVTAFDAAAPGCVGSRVSERLALAHDASHYLLCPSLVVRPESAEQVGALMRVAAELGHAFTFRSAGTSLSGQASTSNVLIDTRRNFRRIEVLDGGARVRVQPGATVRQVNARLSALGRKIGPDPASEIACTVGGVIANNSSGMACGTEFNAYRTIESLTVVLPSGAVVDTGRPDADAQMFCDEPELAAGLLALRQRVLGNSTSRATIERLHSMKNTMGYGLNALLDYEWPAQILAHLVIGSEGTLGFVAEAIFRTIPIKPSVATGLLVFDSLDAATEQLPAIVGCGFAAVELMDARSLMVARDDLAKVSTLPQFGVVDHAALLVEFQEVDDARLAQRCQEGSEVLNGLRLHLPASMSADAEMRAALWRIRKGLYATVAGSRPSGTTALLEDVAVPVPMLLPACRALSELFSKHRYRDSVVFGHAKDGNIHFMINEDFADARGVDRYAHFTNDMVDVVLAHGGTLKAEHGTGRIMAPYVRRQYGDELYDVMVSIKRLIDPANVSNPGVVINDDPTVHLKDLKVSAPVEEEVDRCVECGYCEPVCPSADLTLTPRQRIVLRREIAAATLDGDSELVDELVADYRYDGVQTCAVDGMCQTACPVLINTGDLVRRLRAAEVGAIEGRAWQNAAKHWDVVTAAAAGTLTAASHLPVSGVAAASQAARRVLGRDKVPRYDDGLPRGGHRRRGQHATADATAVYFPSCVGAMFGPADGSPGVKAAFEALCRRAGIVVDTPATIARLCCGTPWKSKGFTAGMNEMRQLVATELRDATRGGTLPVVCDASSCTEGLTATAPDLVVLDLTAFVADTVLPSLTVSRRFVSLALHPTCSTTKLDAGIGLHRLALAISDDVATPNEWRCCAFAGDRGLLHPELTASATEPVAAQLRSETYSAYASTNRTCEIAMTRATGQTYRHIVELVEEATRPSPR